MKTREVVRVGVLLVQLKPKLVSEAQLSFCGNWGGIGLQDVEHMNRYTFQLPVP